MKKITLELIDIINGYTELGIFSHEHKNFVRIATL